MTADSKPEPIADRVAGSAFNLVSRFGLQTILAGISAIALARLLGPSSYGSYASVIALWSVLGATADFGFTMMLSRDLSDSQSRYRGMLRAAYQVACAWSVVLALVLVVAAFASGPTTTRGILLLILAPSMVANGLNPARTYFLVTYQTRRLVVIDLWTTFVQLVLMVLAAATGLGTIGVTVVVSAGSIANSVIIALVVRRRLAPAEDERVSRRALARRSAPLGLLAIMTKVYLMGDLVILGWLVSGSRLGDYAAASKLLTVLAGAAGVVMGGALPALSAHARQRDELEQLVGRIWHWLVVVAIPIFVGLALFAPEVVKLSVGSQYAGAASLLRILCIAGAISVLSNLVGHLMVALHKTRAVFGQNAAAIVLNVAGNLLFVPIYGVAAAAWITAATEALVCVASLFALRRALSFRGCMRVSRRPVAAVGIAAGLALLLTRSPLLAIPISGGVFVGLITLFGAWPPEFRLGRLMPKRAGAQAG